MKNTDLPLFMSTLVGMGELYDKVISELLADLYWQSLQSFEWEDVRQAFERHIHNPDGGQYFPKPADIVRLIEGSGETKALQAWAMVAKAIRQVGIYQSVVFDDAIIHVVLEDMGGWIALCSMGLDEMPFRANEFQKRYMGFLNKPLKRHPKSLPGLCECGNAQNNHAIEPPILIGDSKRATQVMLTGGEPSLLINVSP